MFVKKFVDFLFHTISWFIIRLFGGYKNQVSPKVPIITPMALDRKLYGFINNIPVPIVAFFILFI